MCARTQLYSRRSPQQSQSVSIISPIIPTLLFAASLYEFATHAQTEHPCECEFSLALTLYASAVLQTAIIFHGGSQQYVRAHQPARESERVCVIWQPLFMCIHHGIVRI